MDTETNVVVEKEEVFEKESSEKGLKKMCHIIYLCLSLSFFTFSISAIAGLILGYLKRGKAKGTWLESHFTWQIRTVWVGGIVFIIWRVITSYSTNSNSQSEMADLSLSFFAFVLMSLVFIWVIYRIIRGWVALGGHRAVKEKKK